MFDHAVFTARIRADLKKMEFHAIPRCKNGMEWKKQNFQRELALTGIKTARIGADRDKKQ